jgi:hypothetical protein
MTIEKQDHQVFRVEYIRQGTTNQWKEKLNKEPELKAIGTEKVMGLATTQWGGQTKADENHATIFVSVERDPRYFDMSPELEEAQIAMMEKANQIADREFLKRLRWSGFLGQTTGIYKCEAALGSSSCRSLFLR